MKSVESAMAKPSPEKLNPAWHAAVRRMLATAPQPKLAAKPADRKRPSKRRSRGA